jgi:hypothetical protein
MRTDDKGVGGFFEDLPVMIFVLAGVSSLIMTGVFASEEISRARESEELSYIAVHMVDGLVSHSQPNDGVMPTLGHIRALNASEICGGLACGRHFAATMIMRHPGYELLCQGSDSVRGSACDAVSATRLLNALDENGVIAIVEARVVAW